MIHRLKRINRRAFLQDSAALTAGLAAAAAFGETSPGGDPSANPAAMPMITLGGFRVSRLILGSNPFWGFWHGNPHKPQAYTQEGRKAVMDAAAAQGVTAIWTPGYKQWISLWNEYKDGGGKMQTWIGQPDGYEGVTLEDQITACAKYGGKAVCVQGENVDDAMEKKDLDRLRRWLGMIRDCGLPAGLASHHPKSILRAEDAGLPAEFYHLTLGVPDGFGWEDRDRTLATVRQVDKPMVVFKVMGAGRFNPRMAFPYVFKTIREKDGVCVGADNTEQVIENAEFVKTLARSAGS